MAVLSPFSLVGVDTESAHGRRPIPPWAQVLWRGANFHRLSAAQRRLGRKIMTALAPGPYDLEVSNIKMRLYPGENYDDRVIVSRDKLPERDELRAITPHLKSDMVFVDVGANAGVYSLYVHQQTRGRVKILSIEPNPRTHAKLVFNLAANGATKAKVVNAAVGPEAGALELHAGRSNSGQASLVPAALPTDTPSHLVDVKTLADTLAEAGIEQIDLLKIDIEGFEDQALAPFFETVQSSMWPRLILIETVHQHLWQKPLLVLLESLGYAPLFANDENVLLQQEAPAQ